MNMKIALTTIAGLAVAGAATACECSSKTKTTGLTVETAPTILKVGHDSQSKKKSKAVKNAGELKVIITDGDPRFWVDGKEVDKEAFAKAGGHAVISTPDGTWKALPRGLAKIKEAPRVAAMPTKPVRLGVVLGDVSKELARKLDVDSDEVILIERVMDGTPAAKAGLESFDVLVEFDGEDDLSIDKLRKLISKQGPGDNVEVLVLRDGDDEIFEVVFGGDIAAGQSGGTFWVEPSEPTPPHARGEARAPRAERFFGREMDKEARAHFEKAMAHAEEQAHEAQKHVAKWQAELHELYEGANKDGMNFAFKLNGEEMEDIQEAMELLREHMNDLDVDFNASFNFDDFDMEDFPRIQFIEEQMHGSANKLKERAAVLEQRLMEKHQHQLERQAHEHEREAEAMERKLHRQLERAERRGEHVEADAERHVEKLEQRIEELERVIEKLVKKLEEKPRGVRN